MFGLGSTELIIVLVIVLLFFGPRKIPALAKSISEGIRNFRIGKSQSEIENQEMNSHDNKTNY